MTASMVSHRLTLLITTFLAIAWNYLATYLPLNDMEIGFLSEKYGTYVNPASYAFSIWGLIYLGLVAYAIYQKFFPPKADGWIDTVNKPLILSFFANGAWLAFFHFEQLLLALLAMLTLLFLLVRLFIRTRQFRKSVPLWIQGTFSLYLGWISVAFAVNLALYLHDLRVLSTSLAAERVWFYVALGLLFVLALHMLLRFKSILFTLAVAWGVIAIGFDQWGESSAVIYTPIAVGALLSLISFFMAQAKHRS